MSEGAQTEEFTCPFCGRSMEGQETLTNHFVEKHEMDGFAC